VKIGAEGKLVYVYRGDLANRAIQLAGMELQMFTERKEIKRTRDELGQLSTSAQTVGSRTSGSPAPSNW
jgi:hypothetical protein